MLIKRRKGYFPLMRHKKMDEVSQLKEEILELEDTSKGLMDELNNVKLLEEDIKEKIKKIEN